MREIVREIKFGRTQRKKILVKKSRIKRVKRSFTRIPPLSENIPKRKKIRENDLKRERKEGEKNLLEYFDTFEQLFPKILNLQLFFFVKRKLVHSDHKNNHNKYKIK